MQIKQYFEDRKGLTLAGSVALGALTLFLIVGLFHGGKGYDRNPNEQHTITVSGVGEVSAVPDVATFSFSIMESGKSVAEAQLKADPKIKEAIKYLKDNGVNEKEIRTDGYNVNPKYEYKQAVCTPYSCGPSSSTIVGYEVNQTITVKVKDVAKAGTLLGGVGSAGASNISGLSFTIDNEDGLKSQAREKAIEKARDQAKELAKQLGVRLGKVASFAEQSGGYYPMYYSKDAMTSERAQAAPVANPEIPTGQNKITSNVTITYQIR